MFVCTFHLAVLFLNDSSHLAELFLNFSNYSVTHFCPKGHREFAKRLGFKRSRFKVANFPFQRQRLNF